jgi:hypothetical protein
MGGFQTPQLNSPWTSKDGMILQDGTRVPASELRKRGFVYRNARNDSRSVGGDNWTGNEVDRAAGWYKQNPRSKEMADRLRKAAGNNTVARRMFGGYGDPGGGN